MSFSPEFARKYAVQRVLGEGGMSRVYLATEVELSRAVAIKFIHVQAGFGEGLTERLLEEARVCAAIKHPNVVRVYGDGTEQGAPFVVFEYVDGCSLAQELKAHGALSLERMSALMRGILSGLQAAHELGIVHRDIKPGNILINADSGEPMLMDFGVAKASAGRQVTTQAGMLLGTPAYMAPELIMGEPVTPAADIYAVGVMLYECLAGRGPFEASTDVQLLSMHVHVPPPDLAQVAPAVPGAIAQIVARALAKKPAERFPNAGAMLSALDAVLSESGTRVVTPAVIAAAARALMASQAAQADPTPTARLSRKTGPMPRPASRPERTTRISRERTSSLVPRGETRETRALRLKKRVLVLALVSLAPALVVGGVLWWLLDHSVHDVRFLADDDGQIEVRWTTRHAARGWVGVLPRAVRGSTVTSHEASDTTEHYAAVSGLAPGPYGVAVLAPDGQPVWSDTVEVPARAAARTSPPKAPGGAWDVTAPAAGATAGVLIFPSGSGPPQELGSTGLKDDVLLFEAPFPASGPPPGAAVVAEVRPGHRLRFRLDRPREVALAFADAARRLNPTALAGEIAHLKEFNGKIELLLQGRMKDAKQAVFPEILRERLEREKVWGPRSAFAPLADAFFASAPVEAARAVYERLLDLEVLDLLVLAQHEPLASPTRDLYRGLVRVEYRSDWLAPAAAEPGSITLASQPQVWTPDDYESWDLFSLWLTENPIVAQLAHIPTLSAQDVRGSCISTARFDPEELGRLRTSRAVRLRMVFAVLGPGYFFRVRFRGAGGQTFPLHVVHAGTLEWFAAMDHRRPASVPERKNRDEPGRIYWGEERLTFPSRMLPAGKLAVEVTNEHIPGVKIMDLSYPVNRATVVKEITVAPVD